MQEAPKGHVRDTLHRIAACKGLADGAETGEGTARAQKEEYSHAGEKCTKGELQEGGSQRTPKLRRKKREKPYCGYYCNVGEYCIKCGHHHVVP